MPVPTVSSLDAPKLCQPSRKQVILTLDGLQKFIQTSEWPAVKELVTSIWTVGKSAAQSSKCEIPVLNIFLRTLKIVREEALKVIQGGSADFEENLTNRLFAVGDVTYESVKRTDVLEPIINALEEFRMELKSCSGSISDLSLGFIHSDELVLTAGYSSIVSHFLKHAKRSRRFKVIVSENYPQNTGHKLVNELAAEGISVILIPDSHVFGLMSRVNKVIVSCHAVYPDGTLKVPTGTYGVILAAKHFSIPVYVCLPQYKISPIPLKPTASAVLPITLPVSSPSAIASDWLDNPTHILPPTDPIVNAMGLVSRPPSEGPVVWVPKWEFVPAGLVDLFLTNLGCHAPSYLYALVREFFHPTDVAEATKWA